MVPAIAVPLALAPQVQPWIGFPPSLVASRGPTDAGVVVNRPEIVGDSTF